MLSYRYSSWDGSQRFVDVQEDDLMEELSDYLLAQGDVSSALRMMMQRGMRGKPLLGLQDLLQRLRARRQQKLDQYNLNSVVDHLRSQLDDLLRTEQRGIQRRLDDRRQEADVRRERAAEQRQQRQDLDPELEQKLLKLLEKQAQEHQDFLKGIPKDVPGALKALQQYEFMDHDAQAKYQELLDRLQRQVLDSFFQDMQHSLGDMSPEHADRFREMVTGLNQMLKEKLAGGQPDFDSFMEQHGDLFGDQRPGSLDELLQHLQQQMQQMQSLLESMSPQQRQQLQDTVQGLLDRGGLREEMGELAQMLEHLYPRERPQRYPFRGDDPVSLQEAMRLMEELGHLEELEKELRGAQYGDGVDKLDENKVRQLLGEEEAQSLEALKALTRVLEDAGYIKRVGERHDLTARGMRKIGQKALRDIFERIRKDRFGQHDSKQRGTGAERLEEVKRYEYGDSFLLHLEKTMMNAVQREGSGVPVQIEPADFEVYHTEFPSQCSTVLMLDLSWSMARRGSFFAAKKVVLALHALIKTQFQRDDLFIVGFSTYARELKAGQLPYITWDQSEPYTNMQQGFMLSQKLLSRQRSGTKQIIMISDGEPTAHIERGQIFLGYPPSPRTIQETLREVRRCTQAGIIINTFMLDRSYNLKEFINQLTKINRGRAFYTSPDKLGQYILVDYLQGKRRRIA